MSMQILRKMMLQMWLLFAIFRPGHTQQILGHAKPRRLQTVKHSNSITCREKSDDKFCVNTKQVCSGTETCKVVCNDTGKCKNFVLDCSAMTSGTCQMTCKGEYGGVCENMTIISPAAVNASVIVRNTGTQDRNILKGPIGLHVFANGAVLIDIQNKAGLQGRIFCTGPSCEVKCSSKCKDLDWVCTSGSTCVLNCLSGKCDVPIDFLCESGATCSKTGPGANSPSNRINIITQSPTFSPSTSPTSLPTTAPTMTPSTGPTTSPSLAPTHSPSAVPSASPTISPSAVPTAQPTDEPTMFLDWSTIFMFMNVTVQNTTIPPGRVLVQPDHQKAAENSLYFAIRTIYISEQFTPPTVNEIQILLSKVDGESPQRRRLTTQSMKLTFRIAAQRVRFLKFITSLKDLIIPEFKSNIAREWGDSTLTTGSAVLSSITAPTPPPYITPWWEQFVTPEFIVVLAFIPCVGLIVLAGNLYECLKTEEHSETRGGTTTEGEQRQGQYRAINIVKFGFLMFNTVTDVAFAWSLLGQDQIHYILFSLSVFFVVFPLVGSLYAWLRTKRRFRDDLYFVTWEQRHDMPFIILSILCGSTFGAFLLAHSRLFGMEIFSMNLSLDQRLDFLSQRLVYTVIIEDIPQFAFQVASVVLRGGRLDGITAAAFFASLISIIVGIYNAVNKSEQLRHSQTLTNVSVEAQMVERMRQPSAEGQTMVTGGASDN